MVLSVSAGAGHVRAAQALCAAAEQDFPQLRSTHIDVMDLVPAGFRKVTCQRPTAHRALENPAA